ncbi:MAG: hypothetical protein ABL901_14270 [Hyphomicrobiaceae bacterium]
MFGAGQHQRHADSAGPEHPDELVPQRLDTAGLDGDYLSAVLPEVVAQIKRVCATCTDTERCRHDFQLPDASELVAHYCPNTATIDELIVERALGKAI